MGVAQPAAKTCLDAQLSQRPKRLPRTKEPWPASWKIMKARSTAPPHRKAAAARTWLGLGLRLGLGFGLGLGLGLRLGLGPQRKAAAARTGGAAAHQSVVARRELASKARAVATAKVAKVLQAASAASPILPWLYSAREMCAIATVRSCAFRVFASAESHPSSRGCGLPGEGEGEG